jgi:transposase InsO family protein
VQRWPSAGIGLIDGRVLHAQVLLIRKSSEAFAAVLAGGRLRHLRTRPYTPRTNGKAERFIQTLLREWAYVQAYPTSRDRTAALRGWLHFYNRRRPHASLSYATPWARFRAA